MKIFSKFGLSRKSIGQANALILQRVIQDNILEEVHRCLEKFWTHRLIRRSRRDSLSLGLTSDASHRRIDRPETLNSSANSSGVNLRMVLVCLETSDGTKPCSISATSDLSIYNTSCRLSIINYSDILENPFFLGFVSSCIF